MIDLDGNGTLERDEVGMAAAQLAGRPLIEDELDAAMLAMDADSSGEVDLNEFVEWSKKAKAAGCARFDHVFVSNGIHHIIMIIILTPMTQAWAFWWVVSRSTQFKR